MQFPDNYPNEPLIVELKTKVLDYKLMLGLADVTEKEAKKYVGERQVCMQGFLSRQNHSEPLELIFPAGI